MSPDHALALALGAVVGFVIGLLVSATARERSGGVGSKCPEIVPKRRPPPLSVPLALAAQERSRDHG